jgi:copper(I)-binding protein
MPDPFVRSVSHSGVPTRNPLRRKHIRLDFASRVLVARAVAQPAHKPPHAPDTLLRVSGFRAALVALGAAVLTAACAAGQQAQTAEEKSSVDATQGGVGKIQLVGVAMRAPSGTSYASGSSVPLIAYIVNNGQTSDQLVKIASTAFKGWSVVPSKSVTTATSGATTAAGPAQTIGAGSALGFGLQNLTPSGAGSPKTIMLSGLAMRLYPGSSIKITFSFANAGDATLTVPVQEGNAPNGQTLPVESGTPAA